MVGFLETLVDLFQIALHKILALDLHSKLNWSLLWLLLRLYFIEDDMHCGLSQTLCISFYYSNLNHCWSFGIIVTDGFAFYHAWNKWTLCPLIFIGNEIELQTFYPNHTKNGLRDFLHYLVLLDMSGFPVFKLC